MFTFALLVGIYSYGIFALGILHILTVSNILAFTASWLFISLVVLVSRRPKFPSIIGLDRISLILISLILVQAVINIIGVFGPEIGFDALWYHLTLPKLWLQRGAIDFIAGPVFKYSTMPKLTESLYTAALASGIEALPKLVHYSFGLITLVPLYKLGRHFLSRNFSLLVLVVFYSNLIIGWESTSAYVDLSRTFFETLALLLFIDKKYTSSAITLGLAVSAKLVAFSSLPIFIILLLTDPGEQRISKLLRFVFFTVFTSLPWLLFSALNTGNPFYPLFSDILGSQVVSFNPQDIWQLFTANSDPITPVYIISAPLIFLQKFTKQGRGVGRIFLYAGISLLIWFISPRAGGARFILPYLPAFTLCAVYLISREKDRLIRHIFILVCLTTSLSSIGYRLLANYKYWQVATSRLTRREFLLKNLSFDYGDYIDTNNYFVSQVPRGSSLLVAGINNLYYIPDSVKITHISELQAGASIKSFDYLLLRQPDAGFIPDNDWLLVSSDTATNTRIFRQK